MRILQISPVAPPQRSGMANAAGEIYKATKAAGADVDLVSAFGDSTIPALKHWRVPGAGFLAFTPAIIKLLSNNSEKNTRTVILDREKLSQAKNSKKGNFDIVHLHYPCYGNALMVSLARMLGNKKPLVVSYHMDTIGRGLRRPVFWFHQKFLAPHFLRQASAIVVASRDYAAHSLLAKYPDLMAKVVEIPFGVNSTRFHPPISEAKPRKRSVLFTAALDEQHYFKGLHILLEAMVKVPDAKLTVVGDGNLKKSYIRLAQELKISDRINFAGRVSDEELPKYFQDAEVFCSASVDRSEAYGIVLMEAAASGLPAVASDIPGVRTIVSDGETGLLIPPNDAAALSEALRDLLSDPALLAKMGQSAREFALTRTWKSAGDKYAEIYKALLRTKNKEPIST
jgi:glycosyltransferase involved in cell wall biosynthesis